MAENLCYHAASIQAMNPCVSDDRMCFIIETILNIAENLALLSKRRKVIRFNYWSASSRPHLLMRLMNATRYDSTLITNDENDHFKLSGKWLRVE